MGLPILVNFAQSGNALSLNTDYRRLHRWRNTISRVERAEPSHPGLDAGLLLSHGPSARVGDRPFVADFWPGLRGTMSLPTTVLPNTLLQVVAPRLVARQGPAVARIRSQAKASLPSRIAVIGNYLPRQCGIATFTTDLCSAISAEYGTRPTVGASGERHRRGI